MCQRIDDCLDALFSDVIVAETAERVSNGAATKGENLTSKPVACCWSVSMIGQARKRLLH